MKRLPGRARTLPLVIGSLLLLAYAVIGAVQIAPRLTRPALQLGNPYYSTDYYLESLSGSRGFSARLLAALAPLPQDKAVVLVVPEGGVRSALIAQTVSYFTWPREVRWLTADHPQAEKDLYELNPSAIAAVLFWDMPPFANLPTGIRVGPRQIVVPLALATSLAK